MTARKPKPSPADELRQHAEELLAVQAEILRILVAPTSVSEACEGVVAALRAVIGLQVVGLRLKEGDDYPFFGAVGYSDEFLQVENTLVVRYPDGEICRYEDGTVELECTCGVVLRGDTDPANPLFTAGGSAWTNDYASLLDLPPEDDPRHNPRNRCIHVGFQSLALIPVRVGDEILGLLHIADRRKDRFTAESVRFFEGLGASIGVALGQRLTMQALRIKNTVFDASSSAISVAALDGSLVEVNGAFLRVWGYLSKNEVLGKPIGQFLDDEEEASAIMTALAARGEWQGDYVAKRRDGSTFIANGLATVLRNEDGEVSGYQSSVIDATDHRRAEATMEARLRIAEYSVARSLDQTIQNALDEIEAATGSQIGFFHFVDEDQQSLLLQTWSTNTLATQCTAEGAGSHYSVDEAGVWVDCLREGRAIVHNDYASLPDRKGLPKGHAPLVRELTVPVFRGGRAQIILGVGNKLADYDQGDVDAVLQLGELVLDIVLAKKAQIALQESDEKFRLYFAHSMVGHSITLPTGEASMNEAFCTMLGYTREELADKATWMVLSHPDDVAETQRYVDDLLTGRMESARFEKRYLHKDGSVVWADLNTSLSRNSAGEPMYFMTSILDITQKKRESEELRWNELLHRTVLETAVEGYCLIDQDARFLEVNQAYCEMAGYSQSELLSMEISDVEASMSTEEIAARLREIAAVGEARFESMHLRKDGSTFDVEVCASALPIEDTPRCVVFIRDITERKQAEDALRDMSWRMQSVIDSSRFGTGEWNVQTGEMVFNERWAEILGYTLEELAPISIKTWEALSHPDDLKRAEELLERHFAGELPFYDVDIRMKHKDGHWAWLRDRGRVVTRTENGKPLMVFGTRADIADSKRIENVLTQQGQLLTVAERMASMGSWRIDLSTGHVHWSEAMYPIFGVDPDEPEGNMSEVFASAIHPDDRARVEEASANTLRDGKCRPMEYQILLPDGTARWVSAAGSQELDEVGNVIGLVGFVQDITRHKQAEDALRQSYDMIANLTAKIPGVVYQYRLYPDGSSAFPFSSPGMNDIYEYSPDEVREDATPVFGRLHPDDYDRVAADISRSAETLEPFHCEYRVVLPRQGLRWLLSESLPQRMDDGGTLWYGVISDVTDRKRADEKFAEQAARLGILVDASKVFAEAGDDYQQMLDRVVRQVAVAFDCSCHVRLLSDDGGWLDTAALFNPDPETLANSRVLLNDARLRADDAGITSDVFRTGLPRLVPALTLEQLKAVSPPKLWPAFEAIMVYTSTVVPMRVHGRLIGTLGLHRHRSDQPPFTEDDMAMAQALADRAAMAISNARLLSQLQSELDERARTQAALKHHHGLMSYVVEHMRGAVAVHDRDLKYIYVSERYLSDYGISERDVIGQHHYDVFPDLPEKWRVVHQKALAGEISSAEEDAYPREDGTTEWTCWECRPWYESDGSVGGIIVYTEVITERRRNEEALRAAFEREAATANELLRSAERERRRLAVELHDGLGQTLAAAKLRTQLLASECGGDTSADAFGSLVELLDQSISAVRSLTVDLTPPALSRGLLPALEWLRDQISANSGLHCDLTVDPALEGLEGEVRMLVFRATRELLNNVSRHADADWVRVSGRIDEGVVILRVEDNGCGFAPAASFPETYPRQRFGLDSLRQEVRILCGTIEIDSAPGKGTMVEIRVPLSPSGG